MQRQKKEIMVRVQPLNGEEPEKSEDVIQRELLGPRGVLGAPDPARLSPQGEKNTPKHIDFGTVHRLAMGRCWIAFNCRLRRLRSSYVHPAP
jgi:hypothetical protein